MEPKCVDDDFKLINGQQQTSYSRLFATPTNNDNGQTL